MLPFRPKEKPDNSPRQEMDRAALPAVRRPRTESTSPLTSTRQVKFSALTASTRHRPSEAMARQISPTSFSSSRE